MSLRATDIVVLDTNTLIHWVRQDVTGQYLLKEFALDQRTDRPLLPSIVEGEILGLARCWNWGEKKLKSLEELLLELVRVDAGHADVVHAYAELYELDQRGGHNTGENDWWIAATTKAVGGVLLTCDSDFQWMNPQHVRIEEIPPQK